MERLAPLLDGFQYDDRLKNRSRLKYLHAWHDKELTAGNQWDGEIKQELEEMDIFVPLVSFALLCVIVHSERGAQTGEGATVRRAKSWSCRSCSTT